MGKKIETVGQKVEFLL